jgi:hypothetical protein
MPHRYVNQLTDSRATRYAVLWDLQWRVIACTTIAAGSDLAAAMNQVLEELRREDWRPEGTAEYGFVFLTREDERRLLMITRRHPSDANLVGFSPFCS